MAILLIDGVGLTVFFPVTGAADKFFDEVVEAVCATQLSEIPATKRNRIIRLNMTLHIGRSNVHYAR